MSPLNAASCTTTYLERQKYYGPDKKILFKKPLFDLLKETGSISENWEFYFRKILVDLVDQELHI